jgi:Flp pilus assembly protein CpaB
MLVAGVVLAAVAFIAVLAFANLNAGAAPPEDPQVNVVVAATDLQLGTALTPDVLTTTLRRLGESAGTYQRPEDLVGRVVRRAVGVGQALTSADFETGINQNLGGSLRAGQRAIAVPLSRVDSVGALLQPGDYVDVMLSLRDGDGTNPQVLANPNYGHTTFDGTIDITPYITIDEFVNATSVKVVVQNVQVLASMVSSDDPTNLVAAAGSPPPEVVVVLAVTPQQAEVIRFVQLEGNVSLVMRSPGDYAAGDTPTTGITLKQLIDAWGVLPPKSAP